MKHNKGLGEGTQDSDRDGGKDFLECSRTQTIPWEEAAVPRRERQHSSHSHSTPAPDGLCVAALRHFARLPLAVKKED